MYTKKYNFASQHFAGLFGYSLSLPERIQEQGDMLKDGIHPNDRDQMIDRQLRHSHFIYSLPVEKRNDYTTTYQFRRLDRKHNYINVVSQQQVIQKDKQGRAWIIMGRMDIAPDQHMNK